MPAATGRGVKKLMPHKPDKKIQYLVHRPARPRMEALGITILFSVLLGLLFMAGFIWDQANRGDDGRERESLRPLDEDAAPRAPPR